MQIYINVTFSFSSLFNNSLSACSMSKAISGLFLRSSSNSERSRSMMSIIWRQLLSFAFHSRNGNFYKLTYFALAIRSFEYIWLVALFETDRNVVGGWIIGSTGVANNEFFSRRIKRRLTVSPKLYVCRVISITLKDIDTYICIFLKTLQYNIMIDDDNCIQLPL